MLRTDPLGLIGVQGARDMLFSCMVGIEELRREAHLRLLPKLEQLAVVALLKRSVIVLQQCDLIERTKEVLLAIARFVYMPS